MVRMTVISMLLLLLVAAGANGNVDDYRNQDNVLEFDVFLDGSRIGWHRFDIDATESGDREVRSEARFDVKFLFVTAFRYRHKNAERWANGCLAEIDANTNSNGRQTTVIGEKTDTGFVVGKDESSARLPNCVMTFAYWDPNFLQQPKLLNPQTGEYLDVEVEKLDAETLTVRGSVVDTSPYRIRARGIEVTVWYSPDNEWLALESVVKGGRKIRYELS